MINAKGLKGAPESVADMHGGNNHCRDIDADVNRIPKCMGYNLKGGGIGFIYKKCTIL